MKEKIKGVNGEKIITIIVVIPTFLGKELKVEDTVILGDDYGMSMIGVKLACSALHCLSNHQLHFLGIAPD